MSDPTSPAVTVSDELGVTVPSSLYKDKLTGVTVKLIDAPTGKAAARNNAHAAPHNFLAEFILRYLSLS